MMRHGCPFDQGIVQRLKGTLAISKSLKVDVGIAKGTASDGITTNADGGDRTDAAEYFIEHRFSHLRLKLSNIQGCRGSGSGMRGRCLRLGEGGLGGIRISK